MRSVEIQHFKYSTSVIQRISLKLQDLTASSNNKISTK